MTNETAIHRLLLVRHRKDCTELLAEALNMAIEALQQGCEKVAESCDVISRQDAVDAVKNGMCTFYDCDVIERLEDLPSAQPEKSTTAEKSQLAEEKSTCDLISRQAVQEMVDRIGGMYSYRQIGNRESYSKYNEAWTDAINRVDAELNSLPSAQQEQRCDECVFKPFKQFQPERKKGKWIPCDVDSRGMTDMFVCSKCGSFTSLPILKYANAMEYDYCPNCGSYNGGES